MTRPRREGAPRLLILPALVSEGRNRRRLLLALPLALVAALLAAPAAKAGLLFPEAGGSPNADSIKTLYIMVFILALFIFVGVEATLLWALFRFKAKKGRTAAQIHGNTKLEVWWTLLPALLIAALCAYATILLLDIQEAPAKGTRVVNVTGEQFAWTFSMRENGKRIQANQIVLPVA